jgi:VWFA-related protein
MTMRTHFASLLLAATAALVTSEAAPHTAENTCPCGSASLAVVCFASLRSADISKGRANLLHLSRYWPVEMSGASQEPTFRISVDVIRIDVLVLDGARPIKGLTARDFEVFDNGVAQRAEVQSLEDAPIDVVLALDTSKSVEGRLLTQLTGAATALVDALEDRDRVALLTFSNLIGLQPLTTDRARVRDAIGRVRASGATSMVDALSAALSLPGVSNRSTLVLVFSDGLDTASWLTPSQVIDQARRSDIVIDGVVVGEEARPAPVMPGLPATSRAPIDPDEVRGFLARATAASGGRLLDGSRGERLSSAFVEAVQSFRQRYEITYSPTGPAAAGWHAVDIRVRGHRSATIRARPGYLR